MSGQERKPVIGLKIQSPGQAVSLLKQIRALLMYLDGCNGNLQEGNLRCDVNFSLTIPDSQKPHSSGNDGREATGWNHHPEIRVNANDGHPPAREHHSAHHPDLSGSSPQISEREKTGTSFFIGKAMERTSGRAGPKKTKQLFKQALERYNGDSS
jgi:Asp-tRNA(Asn)/Glu-tRNA(Gln) amidotransferase B subunit